MQDWTEKHAAKHRLRVLARELGKRADEARRKFPQHKEVPDDGNRHEP